MWKRESFTNEKEQLPLSWTSLFQKRVACANGSDFYEGKGANERLGKFRVFARNIYKECYHPDIYPLAITGNSVFFNRNNNHNRNFNISYH
ncbi:MAG: hypothetical protein GX661_06225 [Acholeplasmataceae bacterium]|nr:hypothetical protein [Acholeplasmataceae bacterium]